MILESSFYFWINKLIDMVEKDDRMVKFTINSNNMAVLWTIANMRGFKTPNQYVQAMVIKDIDASRKEAANYLQRISERPISEIVKEEPKKVVSGGDLEDYLGK